MQIYKSTTTPPPLLQSRKIFLAAIILLAFTVNTAQTQDLNITEEFEPLPDTTPSPPASPNTGILGDYTFSIYNGIGLLIGQSEEIVYAKKGSTDKLSQLLWDLMPVFYYKAGLDFSLRDPWEKLGFYAAGNFKFGIPGETGKMEDRDWYDVATGAVPSSQLASLSSHTNETKSAIIIDAAAGVSIPIKSRWLLSPGIKFSYMEYKFLAYNGKFEVSGGNSVNVPLYGPGIMYEQDWVMLFMGLNASFKINNSLALRAGVFISPFNWCNDRDNHLRRTITSGDRLWGIGLEFKEETAGGIGVDTEVGLDFTPVERLTLSFNASYRMLTGLRGGTEIKGFSLNNTSENKWAATVDDAGVGYSVFDIGITAKLRF